MGSPESLVAVANIITENVKQKIPQVVTCSAMSGVTDQLIQMGELLEKSENKAAEVVYQSVFDLHNEAAKTLNVENDFQRMSAPLFKDLKGFIQGIGLVHELSDRSRAYLCAFGERLSTRLLTCYLKAQGVAAEQCDSDDFVKMRGEAWLEDNVNWEATKLSVETKLRPKLDQDVLPVVTGFYGEHPSGGFSLLGRGGSDFSGAILAVSLECPTLEIWTDVDGFLSADPRLVKDARLIDEIGFEEVAELCFFGAKVLHPKTIRPVIQAGGEVWIKNTFNPTVPGTKIANSVTKGCHSAVAISSKKVAIVTMDMFGTSLNDKRFDVLEKIFDVLRRFEVAPDAMASSEAMVSFCVPEKFCTDNVFLTALGEIAPVEVFCEREVICMVSPKDVKGRSGVAEQLFSAVSKAEVSVEMYSQNASEITQLIVVKASDADRAILSIHKELATGACNL